MCIYIKYIRGSDAFFDPEDSDPSTSPEWKLYTEAVEKDWQYFQVRLVGV